MNTKSKRQHKQLRHRRVRAKVSGTSKRPRVAVFKSNQYIYAQVIDDESGKTLHRVSDYSGKKTKTNKATKTNIAVAAGEVLAEVLKKGGIEEVVFDRGGFKFHGRIKAVAEGLKKGGIKI